MVKEVRVNDRIRAREVRLIGENGGQLGVVSLSQALQMARESNLDLVEVSPTAVPPVCRLLNYGKYKYELAKKDRKARKGQKAGLLKEIRLRPRIKEHDLEAKIKIMKKLLEDGDKVRVFLIFRGREATHPEHGWKILRKIVEDLKGIGTVDGPPLNEGANTSLTFLPSRQSKPTKVGEESPVA